MTKIHEKILKADFAKSLKKLIIVTLCVGLLGGGVSAAMLAPWIGETAANVREWKQDRESRRENREWEQDREGRWEDGERNGDFEYRGGKEVRYEDRYHEEDDFFENMTITRPSTAAMISVGITGLLVSLCFILFWLLVAAWLYQAAVRSGMNGLLWLAAGLLGNLFAAAAFLLVRSFLRIKCPACGKYQSAKAQYCSECGAAMHEKCAACGEKCAHGDKFCQTCGKPLHEKED